MRFRADENIPLPTVQLLRAEGLDVESIAELSPGVPDEAVLSHAREHRQILITFDRDFGELVYHRGAPVPAGVLYLRLPQSDLNLSARAIIELARHPEIQLEGRFTVVDADKVRQRPLLKLES
jgi:predicted nuclease of predicted toxin-antitoxin system